MIAKTKTGLASLTLGLLLLGALPALAEPILTGITVFSTDANGNRTGDAAFNTFGGDAISNLYVIDNPVTSTFVNSGDSGGAGAPTGIALPLATGSREVFASVEPGTTTSTFYGINLFFNNNNTAPGISAFTTLNTPAGVANGSGMTLANSGGFTDVAGANSLVFNDPSGFTVTLSAFNYAQTAPAGLGVNYPEDLVGAFSLGASGRADNFVDFTLAVSPTVSAVPEPSTWAMMTLGVGALALLGKKRKRTANNAS